MEKRKILITIDSLRIGGIQTSLVSLLSKFNYNRYEVDLFSFQDINDYIEKIPKEVNFIKTTSFLNLINTPLLSLKKKNRFKYLLRGFLSFFAKLFSPIIIYKIAFAKIKLKKKYDVAISYTNNGPSHSLYYGSNMFILKKVSSEKKITWLHVDYSKMRMNTRINNKEYISFNKIVCVSKAVERELIKNIPSVIGKTLIIYNIMNYENIIYKSNSQYLTELFDKFTIVTVSRIDCNKNIDECIDIAVRLVKDRIHFRWIVLGDGPEKEKLEKKCSVLGISNYFVFLGYINNPYPYIKNSNLYVSSSLSESFGLSIYESLFLHTPVVARDFPALHEYLIDGYNGFIIKGETNEMYDIIKKCIVDKDFLSKLSSYTFLDLCDKSLESLYEVLDNEC